MFLLHFVRKYKKLFKSFKSIFLTLKYPINQKINKNSCKNVKNIDTQYFKKIK